MMSLTFGIILFINHDNSKDPKRTIKEEKYNYFLTGSEFVSDSHKKYFTQACLKIFLLILGAIYSYRNFNEIKEQEVRRASSIVRYLALTFRLLTIIFIIFQALLISGVMSFFYLNILMILLIILLRQATKGNTHMTLSIKGYFTFLIYVGAICLVFFSIFLMLINLKYLGKKLDPDTDYQFIKKKIHNLFITYRTHFWGIVLMIYLSCFYSWIVSLKTILKTVSSELKLKQKQQGFSKDIVGSDSLFISFFINNLPSILQLGTQSLVTKKLTFRYPFMDTMAKESKKVRELFQKLIKSRRKEQKYMDQFKSQMVAKFIKVVFFQPDRILYHLLRG